MSEGTRFQHPGKECDLVMKGGVASGIVYPQAILTLAEKYRFRSIGGTSAGAIAAALAAAAEYGRERGGFAELECIRKSMIQPGAIFDLFQPAPATRPLWTALWKWSDTSPDKGQNTRQVNRFARSLGFLRRLLIVARAATPRSFGIGIGIGLLLGILIGCAIGLMIALIVTAVQAALAALSGAIFAFGARFLGHTRPFGVAGAIVGLPIGSCLGALIGSGQRLVRILWSDLPANDFGICRGNTTAPPTQGLTDWLDEKIHRCAGRTAQEPLLTFGDLRRKAHDGRSIAIDLRAVTTNLSQGRPYVLPFDEPHLIFHEDEMRGIFPARVCRHLVEHAAEVKTVRLPKGYHFLPRGNDLPIVVAARLSLSLPLVLTAVHLHTIKESATARGADTDGIVTLTGDDLQDSWFTDGGISSNFPIQLFDSWLPTRPTFGIRLTALQAGAITHDRVARDRLTVKPATVRNTARRKAAHAGGYDPDPTDRVYLPPAHEEVPEGWTEITDLPGFAMAIFDSARNYHDNTQSALASYRERIAQVRLDREEGGMNLRMPCDVLHRMNGYGAEAARAFIAFYGDPEKPGEVPDTRFQEHRWVRLRVLAAELERQFYRVETGFTNLYRAQHPDEPLPDAGIEPFIEERYAALLDEEARYDASNAPWYASKDREWCDEARVRLSELFALMNAWSTADIPDAPAGWPPFFSDVSAPKPSGSLRVTPEL